MTQPKTLLVTAAHADRPCPKIRTRRHIDRKTGRDRTMIYADETVEVPNVRYYRQRIRKGDLILAKQKAPKRETKPTPKPAPKPAETKTGDTN